MLFPNFHYKLINTSWHISCYRISWTKHSVFLLNYLLVFDRVCANTTDCTTFMDDTICVNETCRCAAQFNYQGAGGSNQEEECVAIGK